MKAKINLSKNSIIVSIIYFILLVVAGYLLSTTLLYLDNSLTGERRAFLTPFMLSFGSETLHLAGSGYLLIGYIISIASLLLSVIFIFMFLFRRKHRTNSFIYLSFSLVGLIIFLVTVIISRYLFLESNPNYSINMWVITNAPSYYILLTTVGILIAFNIYLFIYLGQIIGVGKERKIEKNSALKN